MSNESSRKMLVSGLTLDTTRDMVYDYFDGMGTIADCTIMFDRESGKCRGYGFVTFTHEQFVRQCCCVNAHYINGVKVQLRPIDDERDSKILVRIPVKKIIVSFLGLNLSPRKIYDYFSKFGTAKVDCGDNDEDYKYLAYVSFEEEFACRTCLTIGEHRIDGDVVDVRAVVRKEDLIKAEQAERTLAELKAHEEGIPTGTMMHHPCSAEGSSLSDARTAAMDRAYHAFAHTVGGGISSFDVPNRQSAAYTALDYGQSSSGIPEVSVTATSYASAPVSYKRAPSLLGQSVPMYTRQEQDPYARMFGLAREGTSTNGGGGVRRDRGGEPLAKLSALDGSLASNRAGFGEQFRECKGLKVDPHAMSMHAVTKPSSCTSKEGYHFYPTYHSTTPVQYNASTK